MKPTDKPPPSAAGIVIAVLGVGLAIVAIPLFIAGCGLLVLVYLVAVIAGQ